MNTALYILPAIFFVLGAALFIFGQVQQRKAKQVESWPTTPGVIVSSDLEEHYSRDDDGGSSYTYEPVIEFTYRLMGVEYNGTQYRMGSKGTSYHQRKARSIIDRYPVDAPVQVRYNPENPSEAVLELGSASAPILMIIGVVFDVVAVGIIIGILFG